MHNNFSVFSPGNGSILHDSYLPSHLSFPSSNAHQALPPACGARQLSKLKRFLTTLQQFAQDISPEVSETVRIFILDLINNHISVEEFHARLQEATNFPLRAFVIPFLKTNLPLLQRELVICSRASRLAPSQFLTRNHMNYLNPNRTHSEIPIGDVINNINEPSNSFFFNETIVSSSSESVVNGANKQLNKDNYSNNDISTTMTSNNTIYPKIFESTLNVDAGISFGDYFKGNTGSESNHTQPFEGTLKRPNELKLSSCSKAENTVLNSKSSSIDKFQQPNKLANCENSTNYTNTTSVSERDMKISSTCPLSINISDPKRNQMLRIEPPYQLTRPKSAGNMNPMRICGPINARSIINYPAENIPSHSKQVNQSNQKIMKTPLSEVTSPNRSTNFLLNKWSNESLVHRFSRANSANVEIQGFGADWINKPYFKPFLWPTVVNTTKNNTPFLHNFPVNRQEAITNYNVRHCPRSPAQLENVIKEDDLKIMSHFYQQFREHARFGNQLSQRKTESGEIEIAVRYLISSFRENMNIMEKLDQLVSVLANKKPLAFYRNLLRDFSISLEKECQTFLENKSLNFPMFPTNPSDLNNLKFGSKSCSVCLSPNAKFSCLYCCNVSYCTYSCRLNDWPNHSKRCPTFSVTLKPEDEDKDLQEQPSYLNPKLQDFFEPQTKGNKGHHQEENTKQDKISRVKTKEETSEYYDVTENKERELFKRKNDSEWIEITPENVKKLKMTNSTDSLKESLREGDDNILTSCSPTQSKSTTSITTSPDNKFKDTNLPLKKRQHRNETPE